MTTSLSDPGPGLRHLNSKMWLTATTVTSQAWLVDEWKEGETRVEAYEWEGWRYELLYEYRQYTWTTPSGEIRPCSQLNEALVWLREFPPPWRKNHASENPSQEP